MTSNINISTTFINNTFPVAGTVNDTQVFRNNWTNIITNFSTAKAEITSLQSVLGYVLPPASNVALGGVKVQNNSGIVVDSGGNISVSSQLNSATFSGNITALNFSGNSSGINTGDQTITLTGNVIGSGTGSFNTTIANTGVAAGFYALANIIIGADGRITSASNGSGVGSGTITALNGDVYASGSGNVTATLTTVNPNVGSFGNATYIPTVTVNAKGLVTAVTQTIMSAPSSSISVTGSDLTLSGSTGTAITNATLANTTVTAGFYTSANITVDSKGRITSAANGSSSGGSITALNGDVYASGVGNVTATLSNTTVTAGSYSYANITVDSKGRITAASNGNLSGSSYNSANVQITGGNIDGTWIGNTTAVGGKFTTLQATGNVTGSNFIGNVTQTLMPSNNQTGTTYTLVLSDAGKFLTFGNASATTVTIPSNANVAFYTDTTLSVCQTGAGKVTFTGQSGVTINSQAGNKSIAAQYAGAVLQKTGTDTWLLIGNLIA